MDKKKLIGLRMKELRKRKGLSQEKLAEKADTSPNYVSRLERGTENPTLDMMIKIETALDIELWELFDYRHKMPMKDLKNIVKRVTQDINDEKQLEIIMRMIRAITR